MSSFLGSRFDPEHGLLLRLYKLYIVCKLSPSPVVIFFEVYLMMIIAEFTSSAQHLHKVDGHTLAPEATTAPDSVDIELSVVGQVVANHQGHLALATNKPYFDFSLYERCLLLVTYDYGSFWCFGLDGAVSTEGEVRVVETSGRRGGLRCRLLVGFDDFVLTKVSISIAK